MVVVVSGRDGKGSVQCDPSVYSVQQYSTVLFYSTTNYAAAALRALPIQQRFSWRPPAQPVPCPARPCLCLFCLPPPASSSAAPFLHTSLSPDAGDEHSIARQWPWGQGGGHSRESSSSSARWRIHMGQRAGGVRSASSSRVACACLHPPPRRARRPCRCLMSLSPMGREGEGEGGEKGGGKKELDTLPHAAKCETTKRRVASDAVRLSLPKEFRYTVRREWAPMAPLKCLQRMVFFAVQPFIGSGADILIVRDSLTELL